MPKIIKDVEKTIRNCAFQLFVEFIIAGHASV